MKKTKHGPPIYNVILWDELDRKSSPDSDFGWFTFLDDAKTAITSEIIRVPTIYRYEIVNRVGAVIETWTK